MIRSTALDNLLPHRLDRQFEAGHHDHRFETGHAVARGVGVDRRQRPSWPVFMACSMSSVSPPRHSPMMMRSGRIRRAFLHQVGGGDAALAFDVRRARFQPDDVVLLQLQFGRVLDRDDALVVRNEARQRVEQRRFTGTGTAGDDHVQPALMHAFQQHHHFGREGFVVQQVFELERIGAEAANRNARRRRGPAAE